MKYLYDGGYNETSILNINTTKKIDNEIYNHM